MAQLLAIIKFTIGLPHFSFRELKSSGKYEILFGKYEGTSFPSMEIPSVLDLKKLFMAMEYILGTKWFPMRCRVIDSKLRLENGSVCEHEPTHRIVITNLDYKMLLINNTIQSISIELRMETGQLVPFSGTGKVVLTLQFEKCSP